MPTVTVDGTPYTVTPLGKDALAVDVTPEGGDPVPVQRYSALRMPAVYGCRCPERQQNPGVLCVHLRAVEEAKKQ